MRADRLVSIILLLQIYRQLTARDLSERLEVSERTIHRDMEALSAAGIPVVAERGVGGGWSLVEGYRTNLTGLNEAEIKALFLSQPPKLLADLGLDKASEAALIKLFAAIPTPSRPGAEFVQQRIHLDVRGWQHTDEAVPLLRNLQEAIWQERKIHFNYQRGEDCFVERVAEPLGLVAKGSVWYLVAVVDGALRSYRVSRIQSVRLTDELFTRPPNFDLAAYWEKSAQEFKANLPRYQASVRVTPEILPRLQFGGRFARIEQVGPPDERGWVPVTLRFDVEEMAVEYVLSFGPQIEVLAPTELREKVIKLAESVLAFYEESVMK